MELRQLRQLLVLAETLSFREAADRLNMTQPPLSISIRKLEEELGVRLFDRTTHSVKLTEAGHAVLTNARKALFHAEEVSRMARDTANGVSGRLSIGFVGSAKSVLLPRLLPEYRRHFPNVTLSLSEDSNTNIVEGILEGNLDLGIVRSPLIFASELKFMPIEEDMFVIVLPKDHPLAIKPRINLTELANDPMIHYTQYSVPGLHSLVMMLMQEVNVNPMVAQVAEQVHTVICLVEAGLGYSIVPSTASRHTSGDVVFRPIDPKPTLGKITLSLAYHPNYETAAARRFRERICPYKTEALRREEGLGPEASRVC